MIYEHDDHDMDFSMNVTDASKYKVVLKSLTEDPFLSEMRGARVNFIGHLYIHI